MKEKKKREVFWTAVKQLSSACHVDITWANTDKHFLRTYKKGMMWMFSLFKRNEK